MEGNEREKKEKKEKRKIGRKKKRHSALSLSTICV